MIFVSSVFRISFEESLKSVLDINKWMFKFATGAKKRTKFKQGIGDANTFTDNLIKSLQPLNISNIHHLAMDGPNVNWSTFSKMQVHTEEEIFYWITCGIRCLPRWC